MIVGITGTLGAGKGTIVEFLIKKGFKHYSVRAFIVEEIEKRGLKVDRDSMVLVANDLRKENGPSYIVEKIYEKAVEEKVDAVIESIRTTGEVEALKDKEGFKLFAVEADIKKRYERIIARGTETDNVSFERFIQQEKIESESNDPGKQNLLKCIELADIKFTNNGTIQELHEQVEKVLG